MTNHPNETPEPLAGATIQQHLTVANLPRHPEPHSHTWTEMEKRCILAWGAELVSTNAAALQAKDAEIAGLKAELDKTNMLFAVSCNHGAIREMDAKAQRYDLLRRGQHWSVIDGIGDTLRAEALDSAIDAAIRAQTGGEG